jgi:hypothetical protein
MDTLGENQTGMRQGWIPLLRLVSVMVSIFESDRVDLRENRDFGDSLQKR